VENAKRFNLTLVEAFSSGSLGVFDGNQFKFQTGNSEIRDIIKVLWRYGFSFQYTKTKAKEYVDRFISYYSLQEDFEKSFKSAEEFWNHLEKQFTYGMTKENHGRNGWHIDHIIPLSSAKNQQELEKLLHYTNCRPLWAKDNLIKGNKII
jgi:hypothetical protein